MEPGPDNANIARTLPEMAVRQPARAALKIPRGRDGGAIDYLTLSFAELDAEVNAWGARLIGGGVRPGERALVMVRQGLPLIASVFALFKLGAVPVVIDPGMGLASFLRCVRQTQPRALVGIPLARWMSRIFRPSFRSVTTRVAASSSLTARLTEPTGVSATRVPALNACHRDARELAAILFTSGSTGAPKGVCYEHGMFDAQVRLVRQTYGIEPGEIDLPLLPIFALFNPALGMTTVVPEIDPRRPAQVKADKIIEAIRQESVTNSFGSPTLWRKIGETCLRRGVTLPSLRRVLCAGAPVPTALWRDARTWMPNGELHSPYGATEALPVASVSAAEIREIRGVGAGVGRPVPEMEVRILPLVDGPIAAIADVRALAPGQIGEIVVRGPVVTKEYDGSPEATLLAKIADAGFGAASGAANTEATRARGRSSPAEARDNPATQPSPPTPTTPRSGAPPLHAAEGPAASSASAHSTAPGSLWHRMGDCGYLDTDGRLWFCGRKVERVETVDTILFTEPCEQVFRSHPRVDRCALVGIGVRGQQEPAMVVEAAPASAADGQAFAQELRALGRSHPPTAQIKWFYFRKAFPVDVRHNAKIHRLTLARWAAKQRPIEVP